MAIQAQSLPFFDIWRPHYGGKQVAVYKAGTTALAKLYTDASKTTELANPQTLESLDVDGVLYGKWTQPVYFDQSVELQVVGEERTGVIRPGIRSLIGQDVSYSLVQSQRGDRSRELQARFDDFIHVEDFGILANDSAQNTATLTAAIGAASGQGGGVVRVPAGSYPFTSFTLPQGVVLRGGGQDATTLFSTTADKVIEITGSRAGLEEITIDGLSLQSGSIGVYSEDHDDLRLRSCQIKRFETGLEMYGGTRCQFWNPTIFNCSNGAVFHGDTSGPEGDGDTFERNSWIGGAIDSCLTVGLKLNYEDTYIRHLTFRAVAFIDNIDEAIEVNGARFVTFDQCWFSGNTTNIDIHDDTDSSKVDENTVRSLAFNMCLFDGGTIEVDGEAQDIHFTQPNLIGVTFDMTLPVNTVFLIDPIEDSSVSVTGDTSKVLRRRTSDGGEIVGVTTDNSFVTAWSYTIAPGNVVQVIARAIANQQDGEDVATYHVSHRANRPGSELSYDNDTSAFTVGAILTGGTSGATARIIADDTGSNVLTLRSISGEFEDNEALTDSSGGVAQANGTLAEQDAALLGSLVALTTATEVDADYDVQFAVSGGELQFQVKGDSSKTVEWTIQIEKNEG